MKLKILMCQLLLSVIFLVLISAESSAESPIKPRVAIKEALIGEGIGDQAKKDLNLSTILAEMESSIQKSRKFELEKWTPYFGQGDKCILRLFG